MSAVGDNTPDYALDTPIRAERSTEDTESSSSSPHTNSLHLIHKMAPQGLYLYCTAMYVCGKADIPRSCGLRQRNRTEEPAYCRYCTHHRST